MWPKLCEIRSHLYVVNTCHLSTSALSCGEKHLTFLWKTAPCGSDRSCHLLTWPSFCLRVWFRSRHLTHAEAVTEPCHLALDSLSGSSQVAQAAQSDLPWGFLIWNQIFYSLDMKMGRCEAVGCWQPCFSPAELQPERMKGRAAQSAGREKQGGHSPESM